MLAQNKVMETGVDRFLNMVRSQGKVCVTDLAKELGLSPEVVIERAGHLDECGLVEIEYGLFKTYIVAMDLTQKEIQKKGKEFDSKKEILIRQAGGALSALSKVDEKVKLINEEYLKMKKEVGFDIDSLRKVSEEADGLKKSKADLEREVKGLTSRLQELKRFEGKIKSDLKSEYRKVNALLALTKKKHKQAFKLQKTTKALAKFSLFINKNMKVFSLMEKLDKENNTLKMELAGLIKKAKSVNVAANGGSFVKEVHNLENKFISLDKKRRKITNGFIRPFAQEA